MMEKSCMHCLSFLLLTIYFLLLQSQSQAQLDFAREAPRKIISVPHKGSKSDPQQVHISLAGRDCMRVSWITDDMEVESIVEYGKIKGKYTSKSTGEHTSYRYFFYTSGKIHQVKIGPLEPNTTYYYSCGGGHHASSELSFKTPPSSFPIEFAVVGDLGQTEWTASTLGHISNQDHDVLLLPGDLSYADGQQLLWDSFGRLIQPHASQRPWMVTQGNHEVEIFPIIEPRAFKAYNARWLMPHIESGSNSNLYYSFDVSGAHVVMLGSYTSFDSGSDQCKWLVEDLGKVDRRRTAWVVVVLHVPWYNSNIAHQGEGDSMRREMEELLYNARVDVVFAGHVHTYERFTRIYNKKADPCGPVYITIGDGGNREGLALMFKNPPSALSMRRESSFGHGRLKIFDEKRAHWSWHRNNDSNSFVADELWLESLSSSKACWEDQYISYKDEL